MIYEDMTQESSAYLEQDEDAVNLERTLNFMVKVYGRNWDKAQTVDMLMK